MSTDGYSYELNLSNRLNRHPVCQSQESYRRTLLNIATAQTYQDKNNNNYPQNNTDYFSHDVQKELWIQPQRSDDFYGSGIPSLAQTPRAQHLLLSSSSATAAAAPTHFRMNQNLHENVQQNSYQNMNKAQNLTNYHDNFTYSSQLYPLQQSSNLIQSSFPSLKREYQGNNQQIFYQQQQPQNKFEQTFHPYQSSQYNQDDLQNELQYLQAFGMNSLSLAHYPQNPPAFLQSYIDVLGGIEDTVGSMAKSLQASELKNIEDHHINFYSPNVPMNGQGQAARLQGTGDLEISSSNVPPLLEIPKIKTEYVQMTFADLNSNENPEQKKDNEIDNGVIIQNSSELLEVQQLLGTANQSLETIDNNLKTTELVGKNTTDNMHINEVKESQNFKLQYHSQQQSQSSSSCLCQQIRTLNPVLQKSKRLREERAKFLGDIVNENKNTNFVF